jgi:hypothetical protein
VEGASTLRRCGPHYVIYLDWHNRPDVLARRRVKTMTSSIRFRNSGPKCAINASITFSRISFPEAILVAFLEVLHDDRRIEIAGRNDDRVAKVDYAAFAIGEPAVAEHLQQRVVHIPMHLLDLVAAVLWRNPGIHGSSYRPRRSMSLVAHVESRRLIRAVRIDCLALME